MMLNIKMMTMSILYLLVVVLMPVVHGKSIRSNYFKAFRQWPRRRPDGKEIYYFKVEVQDDSTNDILRNALEKYMGDEIILTWQGKNELYHNTDKDNWIKFYIDDDMKNYNMRLEGLMNHWGAQCDYKNDRRVFRTSYENFKPDGTISQSVKWTNMKGDTLTLKFTDVEAKPYMYEEEYTLFKKFTDDVMGQIPEQKNQNAVRALVSLSNEQDITLSPDGKKSLKLLLARAKKSTPINDKSKRENAGSCTINDCNEIFETNSFFRRSGRHHCRVVGCMTAVDGKTQRSICGKTKKCGEKRKFTKRTKEAWVCGECAVYWTETEYNEGKVDLDALGKWTKYNN